MSHVGGGLAFSFANKVGNNSQIELEVKGKVGGRPNLKENYMKQKQLYM